jgi:geranylgeranyl reductase family protein
MQHYDVIVIGAGPAGASAAAQMARAGMKVALLEKQALPRHKTCGGGMPVTVGEVLRDLAPEAFVEANARFMRHTFRFADPFLAPMNPPGEERDLSLWLVQRSIFDHALARRAAQAGAELRDGLAVRAVEVGRGGVTVRAQAGGDESAFAATARHVVGADGANGVAAKAAGLRKHRALAIAMEVEHPHHWGDGHPDLRPDIIHLEYGAMRQGYAWVFPKAGHLNVGAGIFRPRREGEHGDRSVREEIQRVILGYLKMLDVPCDPARMIWHAHPLPVWNGRETLHTPDGRILLAGDAAGLINPLFGDGILHAVKSGIIAAESLLQEGGKDYTRRIHAEFAANFDAALRLSKFFYQFPGIVYRYGVKRPGATRTATRLLCGDALFTDLTGRALRHLRAAIRSRRSPADEGAGG